MTNQNLTIWTNVNYHAAALELLREGLSTHRLIWAEGGSNSSGLEAADVAFGQPDAEAVQQSPKVRWVHLDSAGYERFDPLKGVLGERGVRLSNSSSVYDEPCAQHALALLLSLARRLPGALDAQRGDHSWPMMGLRAESYLLTGQTVLLLGYGAIARRLVELLAPFGMTVIAVRRTPAGDEPVKVIAEAELNDYLGRADHVVSILPGNASTRRYVNAERLAAMKPGATFYNIGRGTTVDQEALLAALQAGHLAAAALDVTDPEPLPPSHPLWTAPNCYLTPHTAGGHIGEKERLVRHFLDNLTRLLSGDELADRIV